MNNQLSRGDRLNQLQHKFEHRSLVNRNQYQNQWTNHRHNWSNNWNNRHWYHRNWYHGFWPTYYTGFWGGYGYPYGYGYGGGFWWNWYPVLSLFGINGWGVNRLGWATGYYSYYNPYWTTYVVNQTPVYCNYSQPLQIVQSGPPSPSDQTLSTFDRAMQEFYDGKYETALASVNQAIKELPNDAAVHEFRALVLFALGRYDEAAATLYAVLGAGPGWDWTTMSSLYPSVDIYTGQLRALEAYRNAHPQEAAPRFVLAYHYMTTGYKDNAAAQLKRVLQLNPNDDVSRNLLLSIDPDADIPKPEIKQPPKPAVPIQKAQLVGTWKAQRDGDQFEMDLKENGDFNWTYTPSSGDPQKVSGVWAVDEDSVLALDMGEDNTMLAQLNLTDGNLDFYMLGDTKGAAPLKFKK